MLKHFSIPQLRLGHHHLYPPKKIPYPSPSPSPSRRQNGLSLNTNRFLNPAPAACATPAHHPRSPRSSFSTLDRLPRGAFDPPPADAKVRAAQTRASTTRRRAHERGRATGDQAVILPTVIHLRALRPSIPPQRLQAGLPLRLYAYYLPWMSKPSRHQRPFEYLWRPQDHR